MSGPIFELVATLSGNNFRFVIQRGSFKIQRLSTSFTPCRTAIVARVSRITSLETFGNLIVISAYRNMTHSWNTYRFFKISTRPTLFRSLPETACLKAGKRSLVISRNGFWEALIGTCWFGTLEGEIAFSVPGENPCLPFADGCPGLSNTFV